MYISKEASQEVTEKRLIKVLKLATLKVFKKSYCFKETTVSNFQFDPKALAIVRDDSVWSYLTPSENNNAENFKIFRFHFKDGFDNSGFVGWLASKIKKELGTGLFVVCGQNSRKGGIFDYWGCPIEVGEEVIDYIKKLSDERK